MDNEFFSAIKFFDEVDSTNSELLNNDYKDKTLIYTFNQTKGRGRFERNWITFKEKAIALSVLFNNNSKIKLNEHFFITAILATSLVEVLDEYYFIKSWIKWPNDVYIKDKKIAGILTETSYKNKNDFKIVSGIGININANSCELSQIDKKATSIFIESNKEVDIKDFSKKFIEKIEYYFDNFFKDDKYKGLIKEKWIRYCPIFGKFVRVINIKFDGQIPTNNEDANISYEGIAMDIDNEGFLLIKNNQDIIKIINGDIILLDNIR